MSKRTQHKRYISGATRRHIERLRWKRERSRWAMVGVGGSVGWSSDLRVKGGTVYEVHIHKHGRPTIRQGPASGCVGFESDKWLVVGVHRARAAAVAHCDAQLGHAAVTPRNSSEVIHDNGKEPLPIE
jgi:hypothetical protein